MSFFSVPASQRFADFPIFRMSLIVKNQSTDPLCKTTLILAPLALLDQWKLEIETKTNCGLKCLIYHGKCFSLSARFQLNFSLLLVRQLKTEAQNGTTQA